MRISMTAVTLLVVACGGGGQPVEEPPAPIAAPVPEPPEQHATTPKPVVVKGEKVTLEGHSIVLLEPIRFETESPVIEEQSYPVLDDVARVLVDNPHVLHLHVGVHSDDEGPSEYSITLTEQRAGAIETYLVMHGVEPERLSAGGYEGLCPVDEGETPEAWKKNRRVELTILETEAGCTLVQFACTEAIEMGRVPYEARPYLPGSEHCDWP
jgi:outer membrane protein OmpA-like peptidoglycan-associated protein